MEDHRLAFRSMRTDFGFVLLGEDARLLRAAALEARAEVEAAERELSAFSLGSQLNRVNREAGDRAVRIPQRLFALLESCLAIHRQSGGAFDPSVMPLLPAPGLDELELDPRACSVRFRRPGMQLDLGGIGKGAALDRVAEALREAGVAVALLHGGFSTFLALGAPPGQSAWRVGVRDPREPGRLLAGVALRDRALSVSGQQGRGHVLDPRRGEPAAGELAVATAATATAADAWSTALLAGAGGPITWKACA